MALNQDSRRDEVAGVSRSLPVKAAAECFQGGLAVMDGAVVKPGVSAAGLRTVGIFAAYAKNGGADGAVSVEVRRGTFLFKNHGANAVTAAHIGSDCYVEDDETVGSLATNKSVAGKVFQVEAAGVWVTL
jgi:hypothetical protein